MKYWNYDRIAGSYDETRMIPPQLIAFFIKEVQDYLESKFLIPPYNLLSIGIGTGRIESLLSSKKCQVFGVDIAKEMLKLLNLKSINPPCYPLIADGLSLPFSKVFQAILLIQIVHLIELYDEFFEQLANISKVFVVGSAYTETKSHPFYVKFFQILHENGWNITREDEPKSIDFEQYIRKFDVTVLKKVKTVKNSIANHQIYDGIVNKSFSSLWDVDQSIFEESLQQLDDFIIENKIKKDDVYLTTSKVSLNFIEFS